MINSQNWFYNQPRGIWLKIEDIPWEIFHSIWNDYIETNKVIIHPRESKYLIKQ